MGQFGRLRIAETLSDRWFTEDVANTNKMSPVPVEVLTDLRESAPVVAMAVLPLSTAGGGEVLQARVTIRSNKKSLHIGSIGPIGKRLERRAISPLPTGTCAAPDRAASQVLLFWHCGLVCTYSGTNIPVYVRSYLT